MQKYKKIEKKWQGEHKNTGCQHMGGAFIQAATDEENGVIPKFARMQTTAPVAIRETD